MTIWNDTRKKVIDMADITIIPQLQPNIIVKYLGGHLYDVKWA